MLETKYIETTRTARYVTYGNLSSKTKYFWFGLHGSKMRCEQVGFKFKDFDPETHFVVAPEALSKFYEKGFGGDVVTTWMTSRDRLQEISDFSTYLSSLYHQYEKQLPANCTKTAFGFSQGGTTLFRWLHNSNIDIDILLAYSCWIPEDIDLTISKTVLSNKKLIYTYGKQDQFLTQERIEKVNLVVKKNNLIMNVESYDGDHRIDRTQLANLFDKHIKDIKDA